MNKSTEVFILQHSNIFAGASIQKGNIGALKGYLVKNRITQSSVILPLSESTNKVRIIENYGDDYSLKEKIVGKSLVRSGSFSFVFDSIWFIFWFLKNRMRSSIWVGGDAFAASIGLLFQRLGLTEVVVLFATDIVPNRFPSKILNFFYRTIYMVATRYCTWVWCLSPSAKNELSGFANRDILVIAGGPDPDEIRPWISQSYDKSKILYLGYMEESKGICLLLEAFKIVIDKGINAQLEIVGTGPLEEWVKKRIKDDGIESHVKLHGFVKDYSELIKLVSSCCVGMALYDPDPKNYSYFADAGKVKEYLACGLPIILTRVPEIWQEVVDCNAGIAVPYNANSVAQTIIDFLSDTYKIEQMRSSASNLGLKYNWNKAFEHAFALGSR
jgi:glycosyltransferase involved in cell wall biosynthesis